MLTRLEVRGFKNLLDVQVDFGPFTCIAGANGIGKSNVFDAVEFLSYLATDTLIEASQRVRGASGIRGGDPRDLFWDGYRDHPRHISLAAEMIVPAEVEDDLGASAKPTTTFLRYELELEYASPEGESSVGRLVLAREELRHINRGEAARHLRFAHSAKNFRNAVVMGQRRGGAFLSTEKRESGTVINVHGDGGSFGKPQPRAAVRAGRTVLSTVTTNDYPTILAARREMQSWRRLALEPSALRAPDSFGDPRSLGADGRHLAATLFRIATESRRPDGTSDAEAVYAQVADRLSDLAAVGVESLRVQPDPVREVFTLFLQERGGLQLPARALSEGTLRFLALCVLLEDPTVTGLICMEEPENGIHPANLPAMVDLVRDLAVDPRETPDAANPFRQVIINTHAPGVVQLCDPADLLLAEGRLLRNPDGVVTSALSLTPFSGSWRAVAGEPSFSEADVVAYLVAPPGAQLRLPLDIAG
ncbi:AAA family ATPase [Streptosporangium sp. NBC_01755]|uniref:AAA family ATPase n=1 Tax=unclassified Streptosporangium TaxID=2632669 RepID=UPI002DDC608A|nr:MULTISPECIES: AAA family ATPase [unclassified Streptosporangium]WSA28084.1 AAA family ATPase [Streptosporangium sp. NBC_01810]WSD00443.1 AAA family ATPase [Streptosporangium sp. NBC_01755]